MQEIWRKIPNTNDLYEVSNLGRVRSLDRTVGHRWGGNAVKRGKVLKPRGTRTGIIRFAQGLRRFDRAKVHRLVAKEFLPASALPEVNHGDLDKANNAVKNLVWTDRKGNQEHAHNAGVFSAKMNPR